MVRAFWTNEQDEELARLYVNNSAARIGEIMGKSERAVFMRVRRLKLPKAHTFAPMGKTFGLHLPPILVQAIAADSQKQKLSFGNIIREIIARTYSIEMPQATKKGGVRPNAGRKPRHPVVSNQYVERAKPSMPFVPMGRD